MNSILYVFINYVHTIYCVLPNTLYKWGLSITSYSWILPVLRGKYVIVYTDLILLKQKHIFLYW